LGVFALDILVDTTVVLAFLAVAGVAGVLGALVRGVIFLMLTLTDLRILGVFLGVLETCFGVFMGEVPLDTTFFAVVFGVFLGVEVSISILFTEGLGVLDLETVFSFPFTFTMGDLISIVVRLRFIFSGASVSNVVVGFAPSLGVITNMSSIFSMSESLLVSGFAGFLGEL